MAWRPPYYVDNSGQYVPNHRQQSQSYGRGFAADPSNNFTFARGRGYGRSRPEMPIAGVSLGFGRGRLPFVAPQEAGSSSHVKFTPNVGIGIGRGTTTVTLSSSSSTDYPPLQTAATMEKQKHQQSQNTDDNAVVNKYIGSLQNVWEDNRHPDKKSKLESLFKNLSSILARQTNPWESALRLITLAPDYDLAKTMTLSFQILLQFERWVSSPHYNIHAGNEETFLSQEFRIQVLYATTGRHIAYFGSAVEAFHLCHPGNEYFLPLAKALLLRDKLPEAAAVVSKLCLQSHFSRDEILVPLLLTDRVNLIESYIRGDNQQQMLILNLLDHLCARNTDILSFAQLTGLKNIKAEKLSKKSLSKFAMRLIKMFNIPPELCPNITESRAMSTIRFLLYKHYIEKSMTDACWDDMVESVIGNNASLQQQFILELMSFNDLPEAVKWVNRYQLSDEVLDPTVVQAKKNYVARGNDVTTTATNATTNSLPFGSLGVPSSSSSSSSVPGLRGPKEEVNGGDNKNDDEKLKHKDKKEDEEDWSQELSSTPSLPPPPPLPFPPPHSHKPFPSRHSSTSQPHKSYSGSSTASTTTTTTSAAIDYYSLPLKEDSVTIVDTRQKLMFALERLTRPGTAIGIDCEWKPIGPTKQVALLQMAVVDCVFLVDFIALHGAVPSQDWRHFAQSLFCNQDILKIGYGLDTDLRMLSSSYPSMKEPFLNMVRVVELSKLARTMDDLTWHSRSQTGGKKKTVPSTNTTVDKGRDDDGELKMFSLVEGECSSSNGKTGFNVNKKEEKGLSLLVRQVIGKPLCKDEQMSNWEKRPLRRSQILYAAMDAYVLLEIHNHLVCQARSLGVNDRSVLEPSVVYRSKTKQDKKKHKMAAESKKKPSPTASHPSFRHTTTSCRPQQLRVVCDSMLQGLGNQLRACGVDTHILGLGQLHDEAVQIALKENRIILTTGLPYEQIRGRVGESMCYCVSNTLKSKDQCVDVLTHFKVEVTVDDIFSRCAVCNGVDFAHIPSVDFERLYVSSLQYNQHQQQLQHHHLHHHPQLPYQGIDADMQQAFATKYGVDAASLTFMHNGVRIQIETIPSLEVFQSIVEFYVCVGCGKVYWKGSHFQRIQEQFGAVLSLSHTSPTSSRASQSQTQTQTQSQTQTQTQSQTKSDYQTYQNQAIPNKIPQTQIRTQTTQNQGETFQTQHQISPQTFQTEIPIPQTHNQTQNHNNNNNHDYNYTRLTSAAPISQVTQAAQNQYAGQPCSGSSSSTLPSQPPLPSSISTSDPAGLVSNSDAVVEDIAYEDDGIVADGGVGGVVDNFYDDHDDADDLENFDLKQAGFSGVWKIN